jgi:hypothetical protein
MWMVDSYYANHNYITYNLQHIILNISLSDNKTLLYRWMHQLIRISKDKEYDFYEQPIWRMSIMKMDKNHLAKWSVWLVTQLGWLLLTC